MKKIITLFAFCLMAAMVLAQAPALKVDQNGFVGIGTATPLSTFHVKGAGAAFEPADGASVINFQGVSENARFQFQNWTNTTVSRSYFVMFGDDVAVPTRSGEVTFAGAYIRYFNGVTSNGGNPFGTENMRLTADGKLGVGLTSVPGAHKMAVSGSIQATDFVVGSDRKLKSNIRSFDYGLEEILRMSPKFYNYNDMIYSDEGIKAGIIAQEFEKIIPEAVREVEYQKHDIDNVVVEEGTYKVVSTTMIQYALVNAIKEQNTMIEDLRAENDELRKMVNDILETMAANETQIDATLEGALKVASLEQNSPNPFNGQTQFKYFVPEGATNASIIISSNTGQVMKTITVADTGAGVLTLNASDIPTGSYFYTLTIDGKQIDTKKMSLVR